MKEVQKLDASLSNGGSSFSKAFSSLASEDREELLEYAKAGKLTPDVLRDNEKFADILKSVGGNAELAAQKINKMVSASDQLASMKTGISSISDVLGEKKQNLSDKKTRKTGIGADTLAGMPEELKACKKEYDNFCKVLGDGTSKMADCQNAANKLATAFVNSNNFLSQLTDSNQDYYKSILTEMGVANADEIIINALARSKAITALETKNLTNMSVEEISKLIEEKAKTEDAAAAMRAFALEKIYANGNALNTTEDITQLMNLIEAYGITANAIKRYRDYMNGDYNTSEPGGMDPDYLRKQAEEEAREAIEKLNKKRVQPKPKPGGNGGDNGKGKGSGGGGKGTKTPKAKPQKQEIDWIDRRLTSINNKLGIIQAQYENIASTVKKADLEKVISGQNKNLDRQIKLLDRLRISSSRAANKYKKKADSIKISKDKKQNAQLKNLVKSEKALGKKTSYKTLIKKYGQSTADKITAYQNWYDKYISSKKSAEDYEKQVTDAKIQKSQNRVDLAQSRIDKASARKELEVYSQRNKYIDKEIKYTEELYKYQIKIAELNRAC